MTDCSADIFFLSFLWEAILSISGMGRDVHPLFDLIHLAFPTTASPSFQSAMKDGFGEAVVAVTGSAPH